MVPVTVAITELVQLRNPDSSIFGFGGDGDYYAAVKIGNNAEKNSTDHIISGSHIFPNWQFTDYVDDAAGPVQIQIRIMDSDGDGSHDTVDVNPAGSQTALTLTFYPGSTTVLNGSSAGNGDAGGDARISYQVSRPTPVPAPQPTPVPGPAPSCRAPDLTFQQLRHIMPLFKNRARLRRYLRLLNAAMGEFEINTPQRQWAFLATIAAESKQLIMLSEPIGVARSKPYGVTFRGRSPIHLTGADHYQAAGDYFQLPFKTDPGLVTRDLALSFRVAGWYWRHFKKDATGRSLNELADVGDFREITRLVYGAYPEDDPGANWAIRLRALARAQKWIRDCPSPVSANVARQQIIYDENAPRR